MQMDFSLADKIPESGLSDWSSWTTCQVKRKWCLKDRFRLCLNEKSCGKEDKIQKEVASCALAHCKSKYSIFSTFFSSIVFFVR